MASQEREQPFYIQGVNLALDVANGRHALSRAVPPLLLALDAVLCGLIIWKVPYTEIDWVAYMEQVAQFLGGERDYVKMRGGTGPLVYPAAHVYIYTGLYWLTDSGRDIFLAQCIFAGLYLCTLALVMACYRKAKVPPYVLPLLVLSKRLHSIFVLRCFNDCFAALFLWLTIYLLQKRSWTLAAVAYSWGLGVKMSLLLALPAVGAVLFLGRGLAGSLRLLWLMAQVQLVIGLPFLIQHPSSYAGRAFELSRQFLFEWTVNWRFLGEELFLSRPFHVALLALHVSVLGLFAASRWIRPTGKTLPELLAPLVLMQKPLTDDEERAVSWSFDARFTATTVLSANVVGLLFARSLHYQFYAYLAWATPFLLWRSGLHPVLQYVIWGIQEWAWNVFPSTNVSSAVVVSVLAVTVLLSWLGSEETFTTPAALRPKKKDETIRGPQ